MTSSGPNRAGTAAAGGTLSGAEELQKVFKTLADPTRIRILRLLEQEELIVGELMDILGMAQSCPSRSRTPGRSKRRHLRGLPTHPPGNRTLA